MKIILILMSILLVISAGEVRAQEKGIDTQTKTIKEKSEGTDKGGDVGRSWSWDGKTRIRNKLPNPYLMNGRRDVLVGMIVDLLKDHKMIIDESATRFSDGLVVTEPLVFSKGAIITQTELRRYAVVPETGQIWTRGRYTLTVDVHSLDGIRNRVSITAKIEGRSENGLFSEWSTLQSSGVAEDEFLALLVTAVGGNADDEGRRP